MATGIRERKSSTWHSHSGTQADKGFAISLWGLQSTLWINVQAQIWQVVRECTWTIFKVFIEFVTILLLLWSGFFGHGRCGVLPSPPELEPSPTSFEGEVLMTGPPGKSLVTTCWTFTAQSLIKVYFNPHIYLLT